MKITYFVHGTTTDNETDLATGWADGKLSELGVEQSKKLGELVADKKFDVVFSSEFLKEVSEKYGGQYIAIVAHQAPQLALEVLLKGKTWEQAIAEDWRRTKSWQAGWEYIYD